MQHYIQTGRRDRHIAQKVKWAPEPVLLLSKAELCQSHSQLLYSVILAHNFCLKLTSELSSSRSWIAKVGRLVSGQCKALYTWNEIKCAAQVSTIRVTQCTCIHLAAQPFVYVVQ
jgi:hypothetical protein